jgi:hypothetical protein
VLGEGPEALTFTAAMTFDGRQAQVQYQNGVFNGFACFSAFMYGGHEYQLDVQGRTGRSTTGRTAWRTSATSQRPAIWIPAFPTYDRMREDPR